MENFNRRYRLSIGSSNNAFEIGNDDIPLRISFSLEKADTASQNEATISVWNLSPQHKAILEKDNCMVVLSAGYGENLSLAFCGTVTTSKSSIDGADIVTEIHVTDSLVPVRDTYISISYAGVISCKKILEDIAANMGVSIVFGPKATLKDFMNGFTFVGQAKTALSKVCKSSSLEWTLQNGVLQIKSPNTTITDKVYVLNASTGLIGIPARVSKSDETDSKNNKTKKKAQVGWEVKYLMNLAIGVNDFVKVESNEVTGFFRVSKIKISGDSFNGDWICESELLEVKQ